ncbi:PolyC-binding proteins alphaCP-1 [Handroanthus impetiginosus]|uniref:PolyC-binding proteins alphaCP-1 n=1 Tax=Handroanthus impetiginosus TaxID=429701 RepID=A0A2G9HHQ7_9LAMI|nr:PolyC-binding proteins alphaCP-1 [Handroanthus impetiginosus]
MASPQPPTSNGEVTAEPTVPTATSAEQPAAAEAAETKSEGAENVTTETADGAEATAADEKDKGLEELKAKWPGWPGYSVFRLVVPVLKVGGIIGRKGDLIKKLVEETRARVRVLDGPPSSPDRIVLISGKEEPEAALPPAIDAIIRIFKRVNGLPENDSDGKATGTAGSAFCSIRLLVASTQAISLIGKQGSVIKSIQESAGASVRVLSNDEMPIYAGSDERIVELQGEALKVLKALEAVVGHLRKFLVDHSVLPLFEKSYNTPATQERPVDAWSDKSLLHSAAPRTSLGADYPVSGLRDSLFRDRESQIESHMVPSRVSLYEPEHGLGSRSSTIGRSGGPVVTQIAQTMQIPLAYAEDIIGVQGANIDYIRRTSGAILTVQESRGLPDEITVEIKGTSQQVQTAQQLIQEFTSGHREQLPGSYGKVESSYRPSSYTQLGSSSYSSSSFAGGQSYGGYGSSGVGGYSSSFRL